MSAQEALEVHFAFVIQAQGDRHPYVIAETSVPIEPAEYTEAGEPVFRIQSFLPYLEELVEKVRATEAEHQGSKQEQEE